MALSHFVILSVLFAAAVAEVVEIEQCGDVPQGHCSVTEVRITPCDKKKVCTLPRGQNASLSFDFTPNFSTSNLKTMVYYGKDPFAGLPSDDACPYTACPTVSGASQTFNYNLYIGKKLPAGKYPIAWKVWNGDSNDQVCCFIAIIKLKVSKIK